MGSLGNIRGAALDEFFAWYAAQRDGERLKRTVEALPAELTADVRWTDGLPRLVPFTWYPCELIHGVVDQLIEGMESWERDRFAHEIAAHVMESTLRGIYKAMFKAVVSPAMMARFSPRMWKLYYDSGESVIEVEARNRHTGIVRGWKGHHPFLCDINRHCGEWIYSSLGCQHVISRQVQCVGQGDPHCKVSTSWA